MGMSNDGLNQVRDYLAGSDPANPSHMAVGTGTTVFIATDTTLEAEDTRKTLAAAVKSGNGILEYVMTLSTTDANGNTLTEVGIFNADSAGTMRIRDTHTGFAKTSAFSVKYTVRETIITT